MAVAARTESQMKTWIKNNFFPTGVTSSQLDKIAALYPGDVTQGSPFNTGILNVLSPQYKRIAAFLGDGVFQAPRRWMLQNTVSKNPNVWAFGTYLTSLLISEPRGTDG